jgi:DNA-binding transcriptional MerR regulator
MPRAQINPRAVETVLESLRRDLARELRRGQRNLARDPRGTLEAAVKQLFSLVPVRAAEAAQPDPDRRTYRIDELAQISGVTVRNIRAYQERGLLPQPERRGRVALFDDAHLSRLKIITSMLDRGYTGAHISEMLEAWAAGQDLSDVLGLEGALVAAHVGDDPSTTTRDEARELAGGEVELAVLADAGLLEIQGDQVRLVRPDLLRAFAEMRAFGMPVKALVRLHSEVSVSVDEISRLLVAAGVDQIGHRFLDSAPPSSDEVAELVVMLNRFRELATTTVTATLQASLERTVEELLATYLAESLGKAATDAG